jgi:hypothetical protein
LEKFFQNNDELRFKIISKTHKDHWIYLAGMGSLHLTIKMIPTIIATAPNVQTIFIGSPYRKTLIKYPKIIDVKDKVVRTPRFFVKVSAPM